MPFVQRPDYTAIAIAYKNGETIADGIAPYRPVKKELFDWEEHAIETAFTLTDDLVGRTSAPNKIEFKTQRHEASTVDHALDSPVPNKDIENAVEGQDPLAAATQLTMDTVKLNREKRVADIVFDPTTYPASQVLTLTVSTDRFSDYVNSDPIGKISPFLSKALLRPNVAVFGEEGWDIFSRHPHVINALAGHAGVTKGIATLEDVAARILKVRRILVGKARGNMAQKGQPIDIQPLWGKHIAFFYESPLAQLTQGTATFMLTARFGTPVGGTVEDPNIGFKGGQLVRAGESVKELVVANYAGCLIENAFD